MHRLSRGASRTPIPLTPFNQRGRGTAKRLEDRAIVETISVVIPTFRRPEMLQSLLVSLSQGTRVPDEVVVVDNDPQASASPSAIDGMSIKVVHAGLGISLSGARNVGWRASISDICFFVDDDNIVEPDAVAVLAEACRNPSVGLAAPVIFAADGDSIWCAGIIRSLWTGRTRCILVGETHAPSDSLWDTDDMPDAFAIPRRVLDRLDGFDEVNFPIHYDESDFTARVRKIGLHNVVVGNARVRHLGWVGVSPGIAMVRAYMSHGKERVQQMALSRVRFHVMHTSGLQRLSAVGLFLPIWVLLTAIGCLGADAPTDVRWQTARAVGTGVLAGYREALTKRPRTQ
jgi:hypothetical protein